MRKAVLATVTVGLLAGGTGMALAAENGSGTGAAAADPSCTAPATPKILTSAQAADAALQRAGGGRVSKVALTEQDGAALYSVDFVRGNKQGTAVVDAFTGEVTAVDTGTANPGKSSQAGSDRQRGNGDDGARDDNDDDNNRDDNREDEGEDEGEDDGGPVRQGAEANK